MSRWQGDLLVLAGLAAVFAYPVIVLVRWLLDLGLGGLLEGLAGGALLVGGLCIVGPILCAMAMWGIVRQGR